MLPQSLLSISIVAAGGAGVEMVFDGFLVVDLGGGTALLFFLSSEWASATGLAKALPARRTVTARMLINCILA